MGNYCLGFKSQSLGSRVGFEVLVVALVGFGFLEAIGSSGGIRVPAVLGFLRVSS